MKKNKRAEDQVMLVTGGMGFIGSNFLNMFVPKYKNILFVNMDNLSHGSCLTNINKDVESAENYVFYRGDISSREDVNEVMGKYDVKDIVNFAAESHVDRSVDNSGLFIKSNVTGVDNLLRAFVEWKCADDGGIFLQVSTDEVYGHIDIPGQAWVESDQCNPRNIYAATKMAAEHLVRAYGNVYGINYIITRSGNNYGPNQDDSKLIPKMIKKAFKNEPFDIYGDGENFRQWTHVSDNVRGIMDVLIYGSRDHAYNIAGDDILTNNQIISLIIEVTGSKSEIKYVPDRPGHDRGYHIDCSKILEHIGWKPSMSIKQELASLSETLRLQDV